LPNAIQQSGILPDVIAGNGLGGIHREIVTDTIPSTVHSLYVAATHCQAHRISC